MGAVGFSKSAIEHCASNSGFVLQNSVLVAHPKNKSFKRFVQAGTMMQHNKATGITTAAPILIETNTFSDLSWRIFDARFKPICKYTSNNGLISMQCGSSGTLKGRAISERDNRFILPMSNENFDILIMTRRSQKYVASRFSRMFQ